MTMIHIVIKKLWENCWAKWFSKGVSVYHEVKDFEATSIGETP